MLEDFLTADPALVIVMPATHYLILEFLSVLLAPLLISMQIWGIVLSVIRSALHAQAHH